MELWLCDGFGKVTPLRQGFNNYRQQVLRDHADRVDAQVCCCCFRVGAGEGGPGMQLGINLFERLSVLF